jgi:epoxyqueuosine reductase
LGPPDFGGLFVLYIINKPMITSAEIKEMARRSGADLCGIAPVERFEHAPAGFHPTDIYPGTKSVITFAKREIESMLHSKSAVAYTFATEMILTEVFRLTIDLVLKLENKGLIAVPIPSEPYDYWDEKELTGKGILSLKHAAQLSGLGVIGKSTLLINRKYGNLIRLGAILTNATLQGDLIDNTVLCTESCNLCLKNCPVGAMDAIKVSQLKCRPNSGITNKKGYSLYVCNSCRKVCPYRAGFDDKDNNEPLKLKTLIQIRHFIN